jgi:hypothetical protein
LPDLKQASLGTFVGWEGVEFVVADGTKEDCVAFESSVKRRGGKRRACLGDSCATDETFGKDELVAAEFGYSAKNVGGLLGDFGADAVAGENCNLEAHDSLSFA